MPSINIGKTKSKSAIKKEKLIAQKEREKDVGLISSIILTEEEHAPVVARARKKERKAAAAAAKINQAKAVAPEMEATSSQASDVKETASVSSEHTKPSSTPAVTASHTPDIIEPATLSSANSDIGFRTDLFTALTAADIIRDVYASEEIDYYEYEMLKPPPGLNTRFEFTKEEFKDFGKRFESACLKRMSDCHDYVEPPVDLEPPSSHLSELSSTSGIPNQRRLIVTPGGIMLRGLTKEQETRFLKLEARSGKSLPSYLHSSAARGVQNHVYTEEYPRDFVDSPEDLSIEETLAYLSRMHKHLESTSNSTMSAADTLSDLQNVALDYGKIYDRRLSAFEASNKENHDDTGKSGSIPFSAAQAVDNMLLASLHSEVLEPATEAATRVEDAERLLGISRKETEMYEKKLNALIKRNRKLIFGAIEAN